MTQPSSSPSTLAHGHCLGPGRRIGAPVHTGQYCRLFPELPPLAVDEARLQALGLAGGPCDGTQEADQEAGVAAGWPHFGQFVAHDITADRSPLTHRADAQVQNFRTPRPNLECVYAAGPVGSPYLFDRDDPAKLLVGENGTDVPRNAQGIALVGDPRNDVHLFVNQLHVAMLRVHNTLVDRLRDAGASGSEVFGEARRSLMWHYQWVLLHDFLPTLVGADLVDRLLADGPTLGPLAGRPCIPFEFADAAYRYGHSQIRQRYRVNAISGEVPLFPDLMGFGPVGPDRAIDWALLFDLPGHPPAQRAKRIDGRLPAALIHLPVEISGEVEDPSYRSLASRDLQRGRATGLPSGEAVARALGVHPLTADEVALPGWRGETPLWFYVLREADVRGNGDRLGPVGGRIVGEVLVAIIDGDPESFRTVDPGWHPTLGTGRPEDFGLAELLLAATG